MPRLILLLIFYIFAQHAIAASLSSVETQIRDSVTKQTKSQLSLLKKLVNINSGTNNPKGVKRVGNILKAQFGSLGFKTRWIDEPAYLHRAPTLIAERRGMQGKHVLLIGHLDTVFSPQDKFNHFILLKKTAKGPGILDDKGGIVVLLAALKALQAAHTLNNTSITIVLTGDEEDSGKPTSISRKPLLDAAQGQDFALDFEPSITIGTATIGRRGISDWIAESHGNESHSATIFQKEVGDGAIFELSRILNTMRVQLENEKYLTFNPGIILAGTNIHLDNKTAIGTAFGKQNVVARIALVKGDLRYISNEQKEAAKNKIIAIVKQSLPGTQSSIVFQDGIPAMSPTMNNMKLLDAYSQVSSDLGFGPVKPFDPGQRGAGDISYVASIVPSNLSGLGPIGFGTHSVIETLDLSSLPIQTQRAAILIYRLTH